MAGTRGLNTIRGAQLRNKSLRDSHFDVDNKISEDKIDIKWADHRETLENSKIDVFVQVNDKEVANKASLDVTDILGSYPASLDELTEGVVVGAEVQVRVAGSADTPVADKDGDVVYGRVVYDDDALAPTPVPKYLINFFSIEGGVETPYKFAVGAANVDLKYVLRTNLSILPTNAIIQGGTGFVEGATDAKAYLNLNQLMKDIYGAMGTLGNDGLAKLPKSLKDLIEELRADHTTEVNADVREVFEAVGGETGYDLLGGAARPNTLFVSLNGSLQVPGLHYTENVDGFSNVTGISFAPDTLKVENGVPDNLFVWYKKA